MPGLFTGPPKPPAAPKPASETDKSVQERQAAFKRGQMNAGRAGDTLVSPTGQTSPAPTATKTLLGG